MNILQTIFLWRLKPIFDSVGRVFSATSSKTPLAKTARVLAAGVFLDVTKIPLPYGAENRLSPPRRRRRNLLARGAYEVLSK